jgi:glycosyltransferase involved in cell wall biosynthesis
VIKKRLSVSLVIPAYNEERHLVACLDAIAVQIVRPDEVIVVDNNSTDDTVCIAESYSFVKLIHVQEKGVVFSRNAGFNAATCDIIGRIDADTTLPPNWVDYVQSFFADSAHVHNAWTGGPYFYNVRLPRLVSGTYSLLAFRSNQLFAGSYTLWGSNMAIWRADWERVASSVHVRPDIHEDLDLAIHLKQLGVKICYDSKLKVRTQLRRVRTNRHELWDYLQWWPRTLRLHGKRSWIVCWLFGALLLYYVTPILNLAEALARAVGKKPLPD